MPKFIVLFLVEIREAVVLETHHRRAVSEQQQKQQRIQDHGQRPHSVGCYNVSLLHLLRAHKKKKEKKKITQVFVWVLRPPRPLRSGNNRGFL